jgi:hypothetical protein
MMHAPHEEGADRSLRQARGIDRHAGAPPSFSARAAQPAHRLADRPIDRYIVQTLQKAMAQQRPAACAVRHLDMRLDTIPAELKDNMQGCEKRQVLALVPLQLLNV